VALIRRGISALSRGGVRMGRLHRVRLAPPGIDPELTDGPFPATFTATF
jgi:hypothetical protein